ncbi:MAG: hypothetical protein EB015_19105 [Methylocystaceae bacterium]|nr:hypothetical protein [Methylocystaceae bacterium]
MATTIKAITSCLGYQQITGLSAAKGLTVPTIDPNTGLTVKANFALITPDTQGVRWRDDGTNPTSSVGMPLSANVTLQYDGDLSKIKFIEQTASAVLNVSYYV